MYATYRNPQIDGRTFGTGWLPPMPDLRDYTTQTPEVAAMLKGRPRTRRSNPKLPTTVDLREGNWFSPVDNQGSIGSCTAHAATGIVEYHQRRYIYKEEKHVEGSRLFLYKATRNLMGVTGDTGAWLRTTMGALVLCGLPPEKYWPYTDAKEKLDVEPPSFVYAVADNYEALRYFCHDPQGANVPGAKLLELIKGSLAEGRPLMFGFWGFASFGNCDLPGGIPYPCPGEKAEWGHAIAAAGYDDNKKITNTKCNKKTTGALLIRNSWGTDWGEEGYGWLPYQYVVDRLAMDFWGIEFTKMVKPEKFGL